MPLSVQSCSKKGFCDITLSVFFLLFSFSDSFQNRSNQSQGISEEIATAVFSITPNPIVNEINENANAATSSLTAVPVKMLPDYCPPAEDAPCGQSAILVRMCLGKNEKVSFSCSQQ